MKSKISYPHEGRRRQDLSDHFPVFAHLVFKGAIQSINREKDTTHDSTSFSIGAAVQPMGGGSVTPARVSIQNEDVVVHSFGSDLGSENSPGLTPYDDSNDDLVGVSSPPGGDSENIGLGGAMVT